MKQSLWLPFPPTLNNLFATNRKTNRRFPSKSYRAWCKTADQFMLMARRKRMFGPVVVRLTHTPPTAARRDVDNYSKAVLDALVRGGILKDDSQVQTLVALWDHTGQPGTLVEIADVADVALLGNLAPVDSRPALTPGERIRLNGMLRDGNRLVSHKSPAVPALIQSLIDKGYLAPIRSLLDGFIQGYAVVEEPQQKNPQPGEAAGSILGVRCEQPHG